MVRLHEIIKITGDLVARGELALAQQICAAYMDRLDSSELRFHHLVITVQLGEVNQALDRLEAYLETERWFSVWFLQRGDALKRLADQPRFQRILKATEEKETQYWQSGVMTPILQLPESAPPYPLLIAMHGNGFNSRHSAEQWAPAVAAGWAVFHPLSPNLVDCGHHWWDRHEENRGVIAQQAGEALAQVPFDPGRVILGGFSKGGEVAMVLALHGDFGARGFITVGAGEYYHLQPELWQPLLVAPPPGLRGVAMYSLYDLERDEGQNPITLDLLRAASVDARLETYCAEGHVFPDDFAARFRSAAAFVLGERTEK